MTWDPVPFFVGGGAEHSPEVARLMAYAATSGAEGIIDAADLKVSALPTPAAQVRVGPGACIVRNRSAGGAQQTYAARNPADDPVNIATTSASGGRSDLIVARVEDPFMPGEPWADPVDPKVGPYVFSRVIPNVPASAVASHQAATDYLRTLGYSAIPLAGVTLPASVSAVTAAHIKDLRKVARPRRERQVRVYSPTSDTELNVTDGSRIWFPTTNELIPCPEWATQMKLIVTVGNILARGDFTGHIRAEYGWNGVGGSTPLATEFSGFHHVDSSAGQANRQTVVIGGEIAIPAAYRGLSHYVRTGAVGNSGSTGKMVADTWMALTVDVEFVEIAE